MCVMFKLLLWVCKNNPHLLWVKIILIVSSYCEVCLMWVKIILIVSSYCEVYLMWVQTFLIVSKNNPSCEITLLWVQIILIVSSYGEVLTIRSYCEHFLLWDQLFAHNKTLLWDISFWEWNTHSDEVIAQPAVLA